MNVFANPSPARSLRRVAVREMYGVSLSVIDRLVRAGDIRSRRVGVALLLNAEDVEREFGWPEPKPVERQIHFLFDFFQLNAGLSRNVNAVK